MFLRQYEYVTDNSKCVFTHIVHTLYFFTSTIYTVDGRITKQNAITLNTTGVVTLENDILRSRQRRRNLILRVSTGK